MIIESISPSDIYYWDINHRWTYIIRTYATDGHILFGHGPLLDMYYLDINYLTYIIWTYTIVGHTLLC